MNDGFLSDDFSNRDRTYDQNFSLIRSLVPLSVGNHRYCECPNGASDENGGRGV